MKITRTTTMEQLKKALGANAVAVKEADTNLYEQMAYTSKAMKEGKKVTKKDLADLVKDVMKVLGDKFVEPVLAEEAPATTEAPAKVAETPATEKTEETEKKAPAKKKVAPKKSETPAKESSLKTKKKGGITKAEKSEEVKAPAETPATKVETSDEKKEAVKSAKKTGKKEAPATKKSMVSEKAIQLADTFTDVLEIEGETYTVAHDIKDMKSLHEALEKEEDIMFAIYWTARHLRQFNYFNGWVKKPKAFPNDLDLASCLYVSDEGVIAYALSMYTEGMYTFLPVDLEETDGIRYSDGMEFQIYRKK